MQCPAVVVCNDNRISKTQTLEAAIPWLYLKGISTGEMGPALTTLLGLKATGFSAKTVARLKTNGARNRTLGGALGFWADLDETFPGTRHQRCCQHKTINILNKSPKSSQPKVKAILHDIWRAETRKSAEKSFDLFVKTYHEKSRKHQT